MINWSFIPFLADKIVDILAWLYVKLGLYKPQKPITIYEVVVQISDRTFKITGPLNKFPHDVLPPLLLAATEAEEYELCAAIHEEMECRKQTTHTK